MAVLRARQQSFDSMLGQGMDFSLRHPVQTYSEPHSSPYRMSTGGKTAGE